MNVDDKVIVTSQSHPFAGLEVTIVDNHSTLFKVKNQDNKELPVWAWDVQSLEEPA